MVKQYNIKEWSSAKDFYDATCFTRKFAGYLSQCMGAAFLAIVPFGIADVHITSEVYDSVKVLYSYDALCITGFLGAALFIGGSKLKNVKEPTIEDFIEEK